MNTATVVDLILATDGTPLVVADCNACGRTVMHGARDLDDLALGHRSGHCSCTGYDLVDRDRVIPLRLRVLRRELAERAEAEEARRAAVAARRAEAAQLRDAIQGRGAQR